MYTVVGCRSYRHGPTHEPAGVHSPQRRYSKTAKVPYIKKNKCVISSGSTVAHLIIMPGALGRLPLAAGLSPNVCQSSQYC